MTGKARVELFESIGTGVIIECPSGVVFSNQTGGHHCLAPECEGLFVPLRNRRGAAEGIDEEDAAFVDSVLDESELGVIRTDRTKLRQSHEAWVWVVIGGDEESPCPIFSGFSPYPRTGVLTWTNSD